MGAMGVLIVFFCEGNTNQTQIYPSLRYTTPSKNVHKLHKCILLITPILTNLIHCTHKHLTQNSYLCLLCSCFSHSFSYKLTRQQQVCVCVCVWIKHIFYVCILVSIIGLYINKNLLLLKAKFQCKNGFNICLTL